TGEAAHLGLVRLSPAPSRSIHRTHRRARRARRAESTEAVAGVRFRRRADPGRRRSSRRSVGSKIAPHQNIMTPESTRVLVVEDNVFDQQLLQEYLSSRGYQTEFAHDGMEALPKLEADPMRYDVVLTDRIMPHMNGLELLGRIKENPRLRTIPVIL